MAANTNIIREKTKAFAVRIVYLYKYLCEGKKEYVLSKQMLKSGTSIGANVKEAIQAQSKKDFISKMGIGLKECSETEYWLELLHETEFLNDNEFNSIYSDCEELMRILTAIIKKSKNSHPTSPSER